MKTDSHASAIEGIESLARTVRGEKVILEDDRAAIYAVPTKRLNPHFSPKPFAILGSPASCRH